MISVETLPYEIANWTDSRGLKKPRGNGQWNFHFGGYSIGSPVSVDVSLNGMYSKVLKTAMKLAADAGRCLVVVCP